MGIVFGTVNCVLSIQDHSDRVCSLKDQIFLRTPRRDRSHQSLFVSAQSSHIIKLVDCDSDCTSGGLYSLRPSLCAQIRHKLAKARLPMLSLLCFPFWHTYW